MEIKFRPEKLGKSMSDSSDEIDNPFHGYVVLDTYGVIERLNKLKEKSLKINADGKAETKDVMDQTIALIEEVRSRVKEVKLTYKSGKKEIEIKSYDDLSEYAEGMSYIMAMARVLMNGIRLGEALERQ